MYEKNCECQPTTVDTAPIMVELTDDIESMLKKFYDTLDYGIRNTSELDNLIIHMGIDEMLDTRDTLRDLFKQYKINF